MEWTEGTAGQPTAAALASLWRRISAFPAAESQVPQEAASALPVPRQDALCSRRVHVAGWVPYKSPSLGTRDSRDPSSCCIAALRHFVQTISKSISGILAAPLKPVAGARQRRPPRGAHADAGGGALGMIRHVSQSIQSCHAALPEPAAGACQRRPPYCARAAAGGGAGLLGRRRQLCASQAGLPATGRFSASRRRDRGVHAFSRCTRSHGVTEKLSDGVLQTFWRACTVAAQGSEQLSALLSMPALGWQRRFNHRRSINSLSEAREILPPVTGVSVRAPRQRGGPAGRDQRDGCSWHGGRSRRS